MYQRKKSRHQFYQNRKKTAPHKDPAKNIYVNDLLTTYYRKGRFYAAKSHKICAAWSQQGNVSYDDLLPFQDKSYRSSYIHSESDMTSDEEISHWSDYSYRSEY